MEISSKVDSETLFLNLSGDLIGEDTGLNIIEIVNQTIDNAIYKGIIDISNVRYINSSGIGVLITILTKFRNKGGEVCLLSPSENVKKLLIITKLNAIFRIAETVEEAIEKVKSTD